MFERFKKSWLNPSVKEVAAHQLAEAEHNLLLILGEIEEKEAWRDVYQARIVRLTRYLSEN